ncbi:MAG: DNA-binding protein [Gammaproteobacteria bacterium]|nr:DNA-binding protein [Gammaproteobacteria bacterium]
MSQLITLEKQDVKTVLENYRSQGKPPPGLHRMLEEVGKLNGLDRKLGSIPRLKRLLDEIRMDELAKVYPDRKRLPDPISAAASDLYNEILKPFEQQLDEIEIERSAERDQYQEDIAAIKAEQTELESRIEQFQQARQEMEAEVTQLIQQLEATEKKNQDLRTIIEHKNGELESAQTVINTLKQSKAEIAKQSAETINVLKDRNTATENELASVKRAKAQEVSTLTARLEELRTEVIGRQAYVDELNQTLKKTSEQMETKVKIIDDLRGEKESLHDQLVIAQGDIIAQKDLVQALQLENQKIINDNERLQLLTNETASSNQQLNQEIATLKKQHAILKKKPKPVT